MNFIYVSYVKSIVNLYNLFCFVIKLFQGFLTCYYLIRKCKRKCRQDWMLKYVFTYILNFLAFKWFSDSYFCYNRSKCFSKHFVFFFILFIKKVSSLFLITASILELNKRKNQCWSFKSFFNFGKNHKSYGAKSWLHIVQKICNNYVIQVSHFSALFLHCNAALCCDAKRIVILLGLFFSVNVFFESSQGSIAFIYLWTLIVAKLHRPKDFLTDALHKTRMSTQN